MILGADEGAGGACASLAVAAGGVVDVGTGKGPGHTAAGLGAGMGTGIRRRALLHQGCIRIAGRIVKVHAGSGQGIAFLCMLMGAGRGGHGLGIAALGGMHRVMGIHFLCKRGHRNIAQHHAQAEQQGQGSVQGLLKCLLHEHSLLFMNNGEKLETKA